MNAKELRTKSELELKEEMLKLRKSLLNVRFQKITGQLDNPSKISVMKKSIARVKTILTEKNKNIR